MTDNARLAADVVRHAAAPDFQALFELLLTISQRDHDELLAVLDEPGAWDALDDLAETHPEHFVGWYDWSADNTLQRTLLSSPRINEAVSAARQQRSDSMHEPDPTGGFVDADMTSELTPSQQYAHGPAQQALAGDVAAMLAALDAYDSTERQYAVHGLATTPEWWQAVESSARNYPDEFLTALLAADPATRDMVVAAFPTVDRLYQARRRARRWEPTSEQLGFVQGTNQMNVKALDNGDETTWVVGGVVLLIGDGHEPDVVERVNLESDRAAGTVTVKKGGLLGAGTLTFTGAPFSKQQLIKGAVGRFSDKSVKFV